MLEDWRKADVPPRVKAMLGFLEKMTLTPDALGPADVEAVRAAGISDDDYKDAVYVSFIFNTITRVADALGWDIPPDAGFEESATMLLKRGYILEKAKPRKARAAAS